MGESKEDRSRIFSGMPGKGQEAQTEIQQIPLKCKKKLFLTVIMLKHHNKFLERLQSLHLWTYSKHNWMWFWATALAALILSKRGWSRWSPEMPSNHSNHSNLSCSVMRTSLYFHLSYCFLFSLLVWCCENVCSTCLDCWCPLHTSSNHINHSSKL